MHFKSTVFGLIFIAYLCECDALNPGDKGVCTVKQTVRTTVKRWYTAYKNPRCGRRCGIVKRSRPEVKLSSINHSVCCSGWIYNANEEICEAVCSQGCEGRCIAPDTCEPYICDPPCFNAHCAINGCQCNDNFTKYNDTHCHSCGPGYRINDQFTCSPICDKVCVNSECTAPNQCTCLEGYQNSDEFTCEPICENCVNSTCVAPNNCSCFEGFERVNKTVCAPPCVCDNGLCAMRICVCNEGFIQIDGVCQPFCEEECIDGFCSGFNVCSCFDGYEKNEASSNVCRRICQEECNGTCDDDGECFASCVKPKRRKVKCRSSRCPVTPPPQPPQPVCCEGWEFDGALDECKPLCEGGCPGGECYEPGKCRCLSGFQQTQSPNFQCAPKCEPPCENSTCLAPGVCACLEGYSHTNHYQCSPVCENCEHGICIRPNECACFEGYSKKLNSTVCTPVCSKDCEEGFCSAPEECSCNVGYTKSSRYVCEPSCSTPCVNGSCTSPNNCSCLSGFEEVSPTVCKPTCSSCEFGECVDPEECRCQNGYKLITGVCSPICTETCVNGQCTSPDYCSCEENYIKNDTDWSVCYKPCESECKYGHCNLHGECICYSGSSSNGTCKTLDCNDCSGNCDDEVCQCQDGTQCEFSIDQPAEVASSRSLAGLELSWILGGSVGLLLIVLVMVVMQRTYHRRRQYDGKATNNGDNIGSVIYTVPDTLVTGRPDDDVRSFHDEDFAREDQEETNHHLLKSYKESERV